MNLSHLFPKEWHKSIKWLGTKQWLTAFDDGADTVTYQIDKNCYISADEYEKYGQETIKRALYLIDQYAGMGGCASAFFLDTVAKMMADGPKLYRPTINQCMAFENTQVNIDFDFYQQPYPVTLIELPDEYKKHIKEEFNVQTPPSYVFCYKMENGIIVTSAWFSANNNIVNILVPKPKWKDIEEAICNKNRTDYTNGQIDPKATDQDFDVATLVQRLALNFSLGMTMLGVREIGPLHPHQHELHARTLKNPKANARKRERAQEYMLAPIKLIEFAQNIEFYSIEREPTEGSGEGTHRSPRPHWRKGHYRRQRHGAGNTLSKLVFIKPIMVMRRNFVGDLADTSVTYTQREAHHG